MKRAYIVSPKLKEHNIIHFIPLPARTPYGNLNLKNYWMNERKDYLNYKIDMIYDLFPKVIDFEQSAINPFDKMIYEAHIEEFVASLRRLVDELIGLCSYLEESLKAGLYVDDVKISEIGLLFKSGNQKYALYSFLDAYGHLNYLKSLNFISNIFKHSFSLTDVSEIRIDKPGRTLIHYKNNQLSNGLSLEYLDVEELAEGYNKFYEDIMPYLRSLAEESLMKL